MVAKSKGVGLVRCTLTARTLQTVEKALEAFEGGLGWCPWCDEADAPAYRAHEGHDPECPFADDDETDVEVTLALVRELLAVAEAT